jgi:hypothetical protein
MSDVEQPESVHDESISISPIVPNIPSSLMNASSVPDATAAVAVTTSPSVEHAPKSHSSDVRGIPDSNQADEEEEEEEDGIHVDTILNPNVTNPYDPLVQLPADPEFPIDPNSDNSMEMQQGKSLMMKRKRRRMSIPNYPYTSLEIRQSMGPFAVVCAKHYIKRRRVPDNENMKHSPNNHNSNDDDHDEKLYDIRRNLNGPECRVAAESLDHNHNRNYSMSAQSSPFVGPTYCNLFLPSSHYENSTLRDILVDETTNFDTNGSRIVVREGTNSNTYEEINQNDGYGQGINQFREDPTVNEIDYPPPPPLPPPLQRPYVARTLMEVEEATRNWFLAEQQQQQGGGEEEEPRSRMDPSPKDITTELVSLQFNETSLSTIALWVAGGPKRKCISATTTNNNSINNNNSHNHHSNTTTATTTLYRPIVDTRFRMCGICHLFGHYEIECQQITPELTLQFGQAIANGAKQDKQLSETIKQDIFSKEYNVTIEICDGYLIEQRTEEELFDERFYRPLTGHRSNNNTNAVTTSSVDYVDPNIVSPPHTTTSSTCPIPETAMTKHTSSCEIDDFIIYEGDTLESLVGEKSVTIQDDVNDQNNAITLLPKSESTTTATTTFAQIPNGCLVAWVVHPQNYTIDSCINDTTDTDDNKNVTLAIGTVADIDTHRQEVQIHFLYIIEPTVDAVVMTKMKKRIIPLIDPLVWVPIKSLYYVDGRNHLLPTDNVPTRKRRKYVKQKHLRKAINDKLINSTKVSRSSLESLPSPPGTPDAKAERSDKGPSKRPWSTKRGMYTDFNCG